LAGLLNNPLLICFNPRVAIEIALNVGLSLLARKVELPGEAKPRNAIDDPKINGFGPVAQLSSNLRGLYVKDLSRRAGMDVLSPGKSLKKAFITLYLRQHPELYL
jgi:hypothetical protein